MNGIIQGAQASRLLVSAARRNNLCDQLHADGPTASTGEPPVLPEIKADAAFTILELLVVIGIIITLAALILGTVGYVQKKGARSRAEAEIAAMSAALESYKADNGVYPQHAPAAGGAHALYQALSGDGDDALGGSTGSTGSPSANVKSYMPLKPNMLRPSPPDATARVVDPFGNDYNYLAPGTYNPTFDLWSTAGTLGNSTTDLAQWIKNW